MQSLQLPSNLSHFLPDMASLSFEPASSPEAKRRGEGSDFGFQPKSQNTNQTAPPESPPPHHPTSSILSPLSHATSKSPSPVPSSTSSLLSSPRVALQSSSSTTTSTTQPSTFLQSNPPPTKSTAQPSTQPNRPVNSTSSSTTFSPPSTIQEISKYPHLVEASSSNPLLEALRRRPTLKSADSRKRKQPVQDDTPLSLAEEMQNKLARRHKALSGQRDEEEQAAQQRLLPRFSSPRRHSNHDEVSRNMGFDRIAGLEAYLDAQDDMSEDSWWE